MQKILVIHPALAPYRVDFFNSLNQHLDSCFYFLNKNLLNQKFNQKNIKKKLNFEPHFFNDEQKFLGLPSPFQILSLLRSKKPDIVLLSEYKLLNFIFIFFRIFSSDNYEIYTICDDTVSVAKNYSFIKRVIRFFQLNLIDGLILTHSEVVNWYRNNTKPNFKLLVFPIIRNEIKFRKELIKSIPIANSYLKKYNLINKRVLLFVGRLVEVKNLDRLIISFKSINQNDNKTVLVIVGSGEKEYGLRNLVDSLNLNDSVIFAGRFEQLELLAWYLVSGIFILPSIKELFGAVINEALIAGNYVLVSKITGGSSLVKENINGNTFNPFNIKEITKTISKILPNINLNEDKVVFKKSNMLIKYENTFKSFLKKFNQ